jgi:hypothetical protein
MRRPQHEAGEPLQQLGGNMGGGGAHPKESALSFASLQQHRNRTISP